MTKISIVNNPRQSGKSAWNFQNYMSMFGLENVANEKVDVHIGDLLKDLREEFESVRAPQGIIDKFEEKCKSILQMAHNFHSHSKQSENAKNYETGEKPTNKFWWQTEEIINKRTYIDDVYSMNMQNFREAALSETELAMDAHRNKRDWRRSGCSDKFGEVRTLSKKILKNC